MKKPFFYRDLEIEKIKQRLDRFGSCVVTGVHGIGKTETVKAYINNSSCAYVDLRRIKDRCVDVIEAVAYGLGRRDVPPGADAEYLFKFIEDLNRVIVIDETDVYANTKIKLFRCLDVFPPEKSKVIVITLDTRHVNDEEDDVDSRSIPESRQYLNGVNIHPFTKKQTNEILNYHGIRNAHQLVDITGGIPTIIENLRMRHEIDEPFDVDYIMQDLNPYFETMWGHIKAVRNEIVAIDYVLYKHLKRLSKVKDSSRMRFQQLIRNFGGFREMDLNVSPPLISPTFELWIIENKLDGWHKEIEEMAGDNIRLTKVAADYAKDISDLINNIGQIKRSIVEIIT